MWHGVAMIGPPWRLEGVAALIVTADDRYLLQLRDESSLIHMPGNWALFGGHVEAGESDEKALRRELAEELDLKVDCLTPFIETAYEIPGTSLGPVRKAFYEVPFDPRDLPALTLREGQEMKLFSIEEIRARPNIVPWDEFALSAHARRKEISKLPSGR